jgi:NADH:ubiquinone oxidoreductase subunit 3 (subunit A)
VAEVVAALGPGARVSRSTHFVVVSDCEHAWTRDRQTILERTFAAVERFARRVDAPFEWTGERLMCVLIEDHADYRAFAAAQDGVRAEWVAGYYSSAPNRVVFYDDRTAPWTREAHADLEREAEAARRRIATIEGREAGVARMLEEEGEAIDRVVRSERARIEAAAAYESGMNPVGTARKRFNVRFYLIAMVFLVFDVEVVFLYPWATTFANLDAGSPEAGLWLARILFFLLTTVVAYLYGYRKGVFKFD